MSDLVIKGWDSTMLGLVMSCPQKYKNRILKGFSHSNQAMSRGSLFHEALGEYYIKGEGKKGLLAGLRLVLASELIIETKAQVARGLIWYAEFYKKDTIRVLKMPTALVELSFKIPLPFNDSEGNPYVLCGHIDTVMEYKGNGLLAILETKTTGQYLTGYYFAQYDYSLQIDLYLWAMRTLLPDIEITHALINGVHFRNDKVDFARHLVMRTDQQLAETIETVGKWIRIEEGYRETGYPKNRSSCFGKWGPCEYTRACKLLEELMKGYLVDNFPVEFWKPWEAR